MRDVINGLHRKPIIYNGLIDSPSPGFPLSPHTPTHPHTNLWMSDMFPTHTPTDAPSYTTPVPYTSPLCLRVSLTATVTVTPRPSLASSLCLRQPLCPPVLASLASRNATRYTISLTISPAYLEQVQDQAAVGWLRAWCSGRPAGEAGHPAGSTGAKTKASGDAY